MSRLGMLGLMMALVPPEPEPVEREIPKNWVDPLHPWNPKHKIGKAKKEALDKRRKAAKKAAKARRRNRA